MEPAMALCAGIAVLTLTFGVLGSVPTLTRRLAAVRIPIPVRPLAALLTIVSVVTVLARPRPATATVPPPIVRLLDEGLRDTEDPQIRVDENDVPAPQSTPPLERAVGTSRIGNDRTQSDSGEYVVEPGDSLWRIAAHVLRGGGNADPSNADIARFWPAIYAANRALIGDDPNVIFPGQQLLIPEG